jgi:hypothetical protein
VSSDLLSTISSVGTFLVIAATAVVAIIQLRHMRSSNQIAAAMSIHDVIESDDFQEARRFIRDELAKRLEDPEFRREFGVAANKDARPVILVGNYYEEIGIFVKYGLVDENIACEMWANEIVLDWKRMSPVIAIVKQRGMPYGWHNFEYIYLLCEAWLRRYPEGRFPRNRPRAVLAGGSTETT